MDTPGSKVHRTTIQSHTTGSGDSKCMPSYSTPILKSESNKRDCSYETVEANAVTHRASVEYKAFRAAVNEEKLLEQPSDLRFWRPIDVGFLTRDKSIDFMDDQSAGDRYIVVDELMSESGQSEFVLTISTRRSD